MASSPATSWRRRIATAARTRTTPPTDMATMAAVPMPCVLCTCTDPALLLVPPLFLLVPPLPVLLPLPLSGLLLPLPVLLPPLPLLFSSIELPGEANVIPKQRKQEEFVVCEKHQSSTVREIEIMHSAYRYIHKQGLTRSRNYGADACHIFLGKRSAVSIGGRVT